MTYKQQQAALLKLQRIIKTIQNDTHLSNILSNYVYIDDKAVKIDSDEFRERNIEYDYLKYNIHTTFDLLNIFNAELDYFKSKKEAYIREQKIKTILK